VQFVWSSESRKNTSAWETPCSFGLSATSIFLSEQTSHQQSGSITFLSEQISTNHLSTNHQPPVKRTGSPCYEKYLLPFCTAAGLLKLLQNTVNAAMLYGFILLLPEKLIDIINKPSS
jgi:hypothetical protein